MSESKIKCAVLSACIATDIPTAQSHASDEAIAHIIATAELEHQFGGRLLEQGASGVVYRFPSADNALGAGLNLLARGRAFAVLAGGEADIRIAVVYGELADSAGKVAASGIDEALALARGGPSGEISLTEAARSALSPKLQALAARRDGDLASADAGPPVWTIASPRETAALISEPEDLVHLEPLRLTVTFQGEEWEVTAAWPVLLMGRSPNADITVDDNVVSRSHARIEYRLGRFLLIDQSRNGTFVRGPGGNEVFLRQQEFALAGHGTIGLGLPASSSAERAIEFSVTRRLANPS